MDDRNQNWEILNNYIKALPNDVKLNDEKTHVSFQVTQQPHNLTIEDLHNLIVVAITSNPRSIEVNRFLNDICRQNQILPINKQQINDISGHLSFERNGLVVTVTISDSLKNLLEAASNQQYEPQKCSHIKILIDGDRYRTDDHNQIDNQQPQLSRKLDIARFYCNVTDIQALLALAFTIKCYPYEWKEHFFWDVWLVITIQLGLLKVINQDYPNNEVFPCLWLQQVFLAESLVGSPEDVHCLLMGQDPVSSSYEDKILRGSTGVAFHNTNKNSGITSITGMKDQYGLDCTDECLKRYCRKGLLLVNMIRCICRNSSSMNCNCFYDAWFVYSLKLAKYFDEQKKTVVVVAYNQMKDQYLVECILKVNRRAKRVGNPAEVTQADKATFYEVVYIPQLPIFWDFLRDFIGALNGNFDLCPDDDRSALPDGIEILNGNAIAKIKYYKTNCTHQLAVNVVHNLMVKAVKCHLSDLHVASLLQHFRSDRTSLIFPSNQLEDFNITNTAGVRVEFTPLPKELLSQVAAQKRRSEYAELRDGCTIKISSIIETSCTIEPNRMLIYKHYFTTLQAVLGLAVTVFSYPETWARSGFFWDAWLAITIQLSLLSTAKEVFPCVWMKQVFMAERLCFPQKIRVLVLGQDPVSKYQDLSMLRSVENIGDNQQNRITVHVVTSDFTTINNFVDHCKAGVLLANMIRCNHKDGQSMEYNDYYYAWFCYTLKLVNYCDEHDIPVVLCGSSDIFEQYIHMANPNIHVLLSQQQEPLVIPVTRRNQEPITITRIQNEVTVTFTTPN